MQCKMKTKAFNILFLFTAGSKKYAQIFYFFFFVEVYYIDCGNVVGNIWQTDTA